ncbi:NrfD/PsrC family molybdoenzyme membrane anchor subunit [Pseudonocardia kunmingensis]|uniref:Polysulfide reductase NrfD n=1 Tax=Pseudonocardia kunmingensis TaxID=630975 RepID=A0A543DLL9_9PSEU|nr:NrfD/PsrC family molybdoenzyme membrane anchor subunit [Pseudonocardia kunmingensis]TQM10240.1 polysulfide reductase NrfD [Pseudonocardia kunmingensis]
MGRRSRVRGSMVPEAEFSSYYGRPILKKPTWKNPDVPLYLWVGGLAGTSSVIAALADATGRPVLRRGGRLAAAGGAAIGTVALIHDLGRPSRFLNMLRVVKPTSPLSVGSWILAPFAGAASAAAASELTGVAPALGRLAGWGAAAFGPPLASYTGVLLADTAVPAWHEAHGELPVLFAASGAAAGAGAQLVVTGIAGNRRERTPVVRLAVVGAAAELVAGELLERRLERLPGGVVDAWRAGKAGRWNRLARLLTAAGGLGALLAGLRGRPGRVAAVASGAALAAGSLATRFAAFEAGTASAADPEHVVAPQRARLAAQGPASAEGSWLAGERATRPVPRS